MPQVDALRIIDAEWAPVVARTTVPMIAVEYLSVPDRWDTRLVMFAEPQSARAQGYRLLRHRLLSSGDPRVIAVTSPRPGDGKTTCALNLAIAIAEDTMTNVLAIDANLGRPSFAGIFGFEPCSSLIANMTNQTRAVPPYPVAGVNGTRFYLAALPTIPTPGERFDKSRLSAALADLRRVFDYVVLDAASVLEGADANVVGECADGIVLAARARVSRKADLRSALEQLQPNLVLGTVLLDA